ncbi:MAG: SURF1 family cytochrome oxidase biogenesis protein [Pseudomonadota bacterium]
MIDTPDVRRPIWADVLILCLSASALVVMVLLGNWQMDRLAWKLDLIEQVEANAYGEPVPAPLGDAPEYLRVEISGSYQHEDSLTIKALTDLGPGSWVMTPLATSDGLFWVNQGFVPTGLAPSDWDVPLGAVSVTGLVRETQPGGTLLEANDPDAGRWYSADVAQMSNSAGFRSAVPYFITAEHVGDPTGYPRGGLTKLEFRNKHLSYALTWYAMAALFFGAMVWVVYDRNRSS